MTKGILSFLPGFMMMCGTYGQVGYGTCEDADIKGSLLIVGGGLASNNIEIYDKFIELAGGKKRARIGILPVASYSLKSSKVFKADLIKYGVGEKSIDIIPIMVKDDGSTAADESKWIENAENQELADKIKTYTGLWFVGGDQCRITQALYRENGEKTALLNSMWEMYKKGGVIGGTSAGAAVMSNIMIGYGDSLGALNEGIVEACVPSNYEDECDPLYITKGLGFFKHGIVDQHFDTRARLGRLIAAAYGKGDRAQFAFGIDENTAMLVNNINNTIEVLGTGGVTVVDVSKAVRNNDSTRLNIKDIFISFIVKGDSLNLSSREFNIGKPLIPKGKEYWNYKPSAVTGVLSAHCILKDFISHNLIDNYQTRQVVSYCFDCKGKGSELLFRKTEDTKGYWEIKDDNTDDYSFVNVGLDIRPISVTINYNNS